MKPHAKRLVFEYGFVIILINLSTAPWLNPSTWIDKLLWVQKYFGQDQSSIFYKRLIISHHKNLNRGTYLIDDRKKNGANEFEAAFEPVGANSVRPLSEIGKIAENNYRPIILH